MKLIRVRVIQVPHRQVGGKEERELRQRARSARREARHERREDRLEERAESAERDARRAHRANKHDDDRRPAGQRRHQAPATRDQAPAPMRPQSPTRAPQSPTRAPQGPMRAPQGPMRAPQGPMRAPQGPMPAPQGPMRAPQGFQEEDYDPRSAYPEDWGQDVPPEEQDQGAWDEASPEGDPEEAYGGRGRGYGDTQPGRVARLKEAVNRILPGAPSPALKVGSLEVRAPAGHRGLVLELDTGVYLVGDFDAAVVASEGKDRAAAAMIEAARIKLGPPKPGYGMGGAVAVPLVLALLKARREREAEEQAQTAAVPAPALGCRGGRCACGRA